MIANENYLVSTAGGAGSYQAAANDLTIRVSDVCTVKFESNGGASIPEQSVACGGKLAKPKDPQKNGYYFDGWYQDIDLTEKWDFENGTVSENMTLYAKWSPEPPANVNTGEMMRLIAIAGAVVVLIAMLVWLFASRTKTAQLDARGGKKKR